MHFYSEVQHCTTFLPRHAQNSEFGVFWVRKIPIYFNFSSFLFLLFLSFLLHSLAFYWACFQFKNLCESMYATGQFFYHRVSKSNYRKFCCKFFTQISEHFCAYLGLQRVYNSDLGIIRKISPCRFWSKVMKSELEQRPTLALT